MHDHLQGQGMQPPRGVITEGRQQIFGQSSMMPHGVMQEQYIQHLEAAIVARESHIVALSAMILSQAQTIASLTSQEAEEPEKRRGTL